MDPGGLIVGAGIESTSHIHGLFHHTCIEYELVTADATVLIANKYNNSDVFYAMPMSYGTLGFLTAITIKIYPYKPFLRLEYIPAKSLSDATNIFTTAVTDENDSVEGIMYSRDEGVIMAGNFVEDAEVETHLVNSIGLWYKPWFYLHAMSALTKGRRVEYVPTLQFHQRHNKGYFWLTHFVLPYGHKLLFRLLFGWMLPLNFQFMQAVKELVKSKEDHPKANFIVQDFLLPLNDLENSLNFLWETLEINPVWLVPAKVVMDEDLIIDMIPKTNSTIYVDIGVYGCSPKIGGDGGGNRE